ncbi:MAG: transcriptional repressor [Prolixibacteraceae bacterium]|nr:transcriptional repressor [Prolixibacteraceae bacterium]MBN2649869.1 transcriptional repressor [Prolixibacteraceae bacterium]
MNKNTNIRDLISAKGLKVTPQRMRVLEAVYALDNHPTADNIIGYIRQTDPNIASGTVYKVLETMVENQLIKRVQTEKGIMRYDGEMESHHHLYCSDCDCIEDYHNAKLDELLEDFFSKHKIENYKIDSIRVSISGQFVRHKASDC